MACWNDLIIAPAASSLAGVLREHFGLMVVAVEAEGSISEVEGFLSGEAAEQGPCALFAGYDQAEGELKQAAQHWLSACAERLGEREGQRWAMLAGPLGLYALIHGVWQGEELAGCVAALGFVPQEHAATALEVVARHLERLRPLGRRPAIVEPALSRLDARDRRFVATLVQAMAAFFEQELAMQASSGLGALERDAALAIDLGLDQAQGADGTYFGIVGKSEPMRRLFQGIEKIGPRASTVLLQGENGTGKEMVARALHARSPRAQKPFVAVNCAAIAPELIASELFGHRKGAFSGAHRDYDGLFAAAHGGTLLLDEIGDMALGLQVKLLRVLQEGVYTPVGDTQPRRADVRVIVATHRNLEDMVRRGQFREDLFYRIRVMTLDLPSLRERREDIAVLADHFLQKACRRHGLGPKSLLPACLDVLGRYDWPGNVRELENEMERAAILSGTDERLGPELLSPRVQSIPSGPELEWNLEGLALPEAIERLERRMISESLARYRGNKSKAAIDLGVSRRNLIRKVQGYAMEAAMSGDED